MSGARMVGGVAAGHGATGVAPLGRAGTDAPEGRAGTGIPGGQAGTGVPGGHAGAGAPWRPAATVAPDGSAGTRGAAGRPAAGRDDRDAAGFTLLEVLVAFTMLALVLGAAYASLGAGTRAQDAAERRLAALTLAESAIERAGGDLAWEAGRHEWREGDLVVGLDLAPHRPADRALWAAIGTAPWRASVRVTDADGATLAALATLRLGPPP